MKKDKENIPFLDDQSENIPLQEVVQKNKPRSTSKKRKLILAALTIIVIVLGGIYYYLNYSKANIEKRAQAETTRLIKKVRKIILLPETEIPAIFDIQDPVLLVQQQPFFAGVEKGDKLLVYPQNGKAFIYSQKKNIIVNVGPVNFNQSGTSQETNTVNVPSGDGLQ